jgi:hypothetical protein
MAFTSESAHLADGGGREKVLQVEALELLLLRHRIQLLRRRHGACATVSRTVCSNADDAHPVRREVSSYTQGGMLHWRELAALAWHTQRWKPVADCVADPAW